MTKNKINNEELLALIIEGIDNVKGENIAILDLREIENTVCDYFVICDGNSNTQVNAISGSIQKTVSKELKDKPWHVEGTEQANWVLMDYVNIVVHIFQKETREYYNIEDLWGDAKFVQVQTNSKTQ
ncbi:ribosome silencing factor [Myroides ceti]|jgi:ribosome-associated protein|uniref:Ribosomal silencing factor RsfS n=1 Tax=Paenimyroides ceti TaxID=395087 RepID=A0ABT8CVS0_9FLAO|nr:ribosome silencing factor [Paenimyroides ceti]MDN3707826.1 ribosome silencing factor [Paenimyroides ceti]